MKVEKMVSKYYVKLRRKQLDDLFIYISVRYYGL